MFVASEVRRYMFLLIAYKIRLLAYKNNILHYHFGNKSEAKLAFDVGTNYKQLKII